MKDKVYWTMQNGEKISVDDMDITHLRNTLKMLIRNSQKREKRIGLNGDIAQMFNDDQQYEEDCDATEFNIW